MPWGEELKDFYDEQSMFSFIPEFFKPDQIVFVLFCRNLLQIATAWFLSHQYMLLQLVLCEAGEGETR